MTSLILRKMFLPVTDLIDENIQELTRLDSLIGDGDHGVTMEKISKVIRNSMLTIDGTEEAADVLEDLSWDIMNISGGSAGPLVGSFIEGMAEGARVLTDDEEEFVRNVLAEGYENFKMVSGATIGNKTMMDAIQPATEALERESDFNRALKEMAQAAQDGADDTVNMIAKYGRARSLKEKSIGYKDPGAVSFSLFYKGIAEGLMK